MPRIVSYSYQVYTSRSVYQNILSPLFKYSFGSRVSFHRLVSLFPLFSPFSGSQTPHTPFARALRDEAPRKTCRQQLIAPFSTKSATLFTHISNMARGECTQVSPECPVTATTLGYYPNKPLNIVIAVLFAVAAIIALVFGIRKRTWGYMSFLVAGCILEMAGRWDFFLKKNSCVQDDKRERAGGRAYGWTTKPGALFRWAKVLQPSWNQWPLQVLV